jgi:DNA-binding GntR family transcriptional regulator
METGGGDMPIFKNRRLEIKPASLAYQVADILTQAILEGDYKGGDQLVEMELQAHLDISRSPLREAFRELEKKGLVEIVPRKGTFVKRITRKDVEENFPVRAELEGLAARLAAPHLTTADLNELADILDKMKAAVTQGDTKSYYNYHLKFHETFIEISNNALLISLLKNLRMQSLWHRFSYRYYLEDLVKSFKVHSKILDLFRKTPPVPEAVGKMVQQHINVALDRFLAYLEDFEQI